MKKKNYHPIFSDAPSHMGGIYLMQSIKHNQTTRNASLKKLGIVQNAGLTKGLSKVESMNTLKLNRDTSKLPRLGADKKYHPFRTKEHSPHPRNSLGLYSIKGKSTTQDKTPDLENILNCSSIANEDGRDGFTLDDSRKEEIEDKKHYILNAKSYKIEEIGNINEDFLESTVPVQKIKTFLNWLGGNFTQQNLMEFTTESNFIIEQPFESVKKVKALREVSLLILSMVKFDLIQEEVSLINSINILLKSFYSVLKEDPSPKFVAKLFDTLDFMTKLDVPAQNQYLYQMVDFLNEMSEKVQSIPSNLQEFVLCRSFELLTKVLPQLLESSALEETPTYQFLKLSEKSAWVFIESMCEEESNRAVILGQEPILKELAHLVMYVSEQLEVLAETEPSNQKTAVVYCDYFAIIFSAVKNAEVMRKLTEFVSNETLCVSRATEGLLNYIAKLMHHSLFTEKVEEKLEKVVRLCHRSILKIGPHRLLEVERIMGSFFKIFCEKSFEMSSNRMINFSIELVLLMKEVAFARKETFVKAYRNNRKHLDEIVVNFNLASVHSNKKNFTRQKEHFLKPLVEIMGLLKS